MSFQTSTREKFVPLPTLTKPTGGGITQIDLPRSGLLGRLYLNISATVTGSLSAPNAYGAASIIRRVILRLNTGIDVVNMSGAGFHWLLRDFVDNYLDVTPQATARNAVTATTFNCDMVIPIAINAKDPIGMLMLQNEETLCTLIIDWEADASVATGATVTATCVPSLQLFEVPQKTDDYPPLNLVQQILEDSISVPAGADFTYNWQRGGNYLGVYHLMTTNGFSRALLRTQQSYFLADYTPTRMIVRQNSINQRDLTLSGGAVTGNDKRIFFDFMGTDGMGAYGIGRDLMDSSRLTDLASVITPAGAATLLTVRRQLISVR